MIALETLLQQKFEPTRSIVVAFGFDEEASGVYGAQELGKYMDEVYGKDGIAMIVDEGSKFPYHLRCPSPTSPSSI
jgi:Gly-Xaa carboxypeptidase